MKFRLNNRLFLVVIVAFISLESVSPKANQAKSYLEKVCHHSTNKNVANKLFFNTLQLSSADTQHLLRSKATSGALCDSIILTISNSSATTKLIYNYNQDGLVLSELGYTKNTDSEPYTLTSKHYYMYDEHKNKTLDEALTLMYENHWSAYSPRYEALYDQVGNCQHEIQSEWDENESVWNETTKTVYDYSNAGSKVVITQYNKNDQTNKWLIYSILTRTIYSKQHNLEEAYTYDTQSQKTLLYQHTKNYKNIYMQDSLSLSAYENYADGQSVSYSYDSVTCDYNSAHQLLNRSEYTVEPVNNSWKLFYELRNQYNQAGNVTQSYSGYSNSIENDTFIYEYDESGKTLKSISHYRNDTKDSKRVFNYDENGNTANCYYYTNRDNEWEFNIKWTYFYAGSTGFAVNPVTKNCIYPNPAKSYFQINGLNEKATVTIYNAQGKACKVLKVYQNEPIFTDKLHSGNYLISVQTASGSFSQKLVVE